MTESHLYRQMKEADEMLTIAIQNDEPPESLEYLRERLDNARSAWALWQSLPSTVEAKNAIPQT